MEQRGLSAERQGGQQWPGAQGQGAPATGRATAVSCLPPTETLPGSSAERSSISPSPPGGPTCSEGSGGLAALQLRAPVEAGALVGPGEAGLARRRPQERRVGLTGGEGQGCILAHFRHPLEGNNECIHASRRQIYSDCQHLSSSIDMIPALGRN